MKYLLKMIKFRHFYINDNRGTTTNEKRATSFKSIEYAQDKLNELDSKYILRKKDWMIISS